ncbi:MAG: hypothetical protein JW841_18740 [Deltaproteobacteria bacterium]|nr:hypothetical protein [Deltaproteobacteria bacterium]
MRIGIAQQTNELRELVLRHFPPGTRVTAPKGGFFLWIEYNSKIDAIELFKKAIVHKISISPGPAFTIEDKFHNAIRLCSGIPIDKRVIRAIRQLGEWLK